MRQLISLVVLSVISTTASTAAAFCGFYVGGDDSKLYNDATQVVLMRHGTTTVLSMQNNYEGPAEDFAMVVPVPQVLQKENVRTLPKSMFDTVDRLSAPRLVEYWEQDPCPRDVAEDEARSERGIGGIGSGSGYGKGAGNLGSVRVEAQFEVGEYDIVVLSATQGTALEAWLEQNDFKTPAGAAPYYQPYVTGGSYFFVAKVNVKRVTYKDGRAVLSPLRFHYDEDEFKLPVRLGLINARDKQDLLVYILAENQRYEVANYPNVTIPTNLEVRDEVRENFGGFYEALFDQTLREKPNSVVTEYSWQASGCDPCPGGVNGMAPTQLHTLGADTLDMSKPRGAFFAVPGAPVVKGALDREIIRRVVRRHRRGLRDCANQGGDDFSGGPVSLEFAVDERGLVTRAAVRGEGVDSFASCTTAAMKKWAFPRPTSGTVKVSFPITFRRRNTGPTWVLTRLHARYSRASLGEDLVFRKAKAISGGRQSHGTPNSQNASESIVNNFQGRYIIRHEWKGEATCAEPRFGVWGGPPSGQRPAAKAAASRNTTGGKPKAVSLEKQLRGEIVGFGPLTQPVEAASPVQEPHAGAEAPGKAKSGCQTARGLSEPWPLLVALIFFRRRRQ